MLSIIQQIDIYILNFIQDYLHNPIADKVMIYITMIGDKGLVWIIISLWLIAYKKYRKVGLMTLSALLLSALLGDVILKNIIQRERPFMYLDNVDLLIPPPSSFSFPSGHTAASFAAAGILAESFKKYAAPIFTLASLIAFSRLYLYVHYPTDIMGGIILGLICANWVRRFFNKVLKIRLKTADLQSRHRDHIDKL